jgi:hypothetical protein
VEEEQEEDEEDVGDAYLQAEPQAILDSLRSEVEAEHAATVDEMLTYMAEEEGPEPSYAPIYPTPVAEVVDIADDEA